MYCPRCGSDRVLVTVVENHYQVRDYHGCLWGLLVGWWWVPIKWICFTGYALLAKLLLPARTRTVRRDRTVCVCQSCGYHWNA